MTLTIGEIIEDLNGLTMDTPEEREFVLELLEGAMQEIREMEPNEDLEYEIERDLREFP